MTKNLLQWAKDNRRYLIAGFIAILIWDQFMRADDERMCSNDATAHANCGR